MLCTSTHVLDVLTYAYAPTCPPCESWAINTCTLLYQPAVALHPLTRDAAPSHTFPDRTAFPLLRARPRGHGQSLRARAARGTTPRALVLSWGAGFYGQTGLGANLDVYEPQEVGVLGQGFRVLAVGFWI